MLDERVRETLARLEREEVRPPAVPVAPTTGRFLFSLVAPQTDCEVLEIGAGRGYSSIWLGAGVRYFGGRVLSLERNPRAAERWCTNVADAGLADWVELVEGDAFETLNGLRDVFDVVFLDAEKEDYEALFALARERLEPGGLVIADNVLSHADTLAAYTRARQSDRTLSSVTVPIDRGLELTVVLGPPHATAPSG
jgi:caffeoyl-CoA O-methyltransferase